MTPYYSFLLYARAAEKEEERRARLENDAASKQPTLAMEMDEETRAKRRNGFEMDLFGLRLEF